MDKNTFMRELEQSLSVLQESELKDILSEYEQHIDMKVKSGLTEEEAIEDFGSLSELTAEILEAYHVRADYDGGRRSGRGWKTAAGSRKDRKESAAGQESGEGGSFWHGEEWKTRAADAGKRTAGVLSGLGRRTAGLARRAGTWILEILVFWRGLLGRPFRRLAKVWEQRNGERIHPDAGDTETGMAGTPGGDTGAALKRTRNPAGRRLLALVKKCADCAAGLVCGTVRLFWNGAWIFLAGCLFFLGLFFLFCLGLLAVLMLQGYPVAGVTVGCLGAAASLFSAAGLGMTFLRKRKKDGDQKTGKTEQTLKKEDADTGREEASPGLEADGEATRKAEQEESRDNAEHESRCRKEGGQYA